MKYLTTLFIIILFASCKNDEFVYTYLSSYFWDGEIIKVSGETDNKSSLETNDWAFELKNGKTISKGRFQDGMRIDEWIYTLHRDTTMKLDWAIHRDLSKNIKLSYPKNWSIYKQTDRIFEAYFETPSPIKNTKFFAVTYNNKDSINMSLQEYLEYSSNKIAHEEKLKKHYSIEIANKTDTAYYSIIKLIRNEEDIMILDYIFEHENKIIELTYSTLDIEPEFKNQIFLDFISCFYFEEKRAYNPLNKNSITIKL